MGARIRLAPQRDWEGQTTPPELEKVLGTLEGIQQAFKPLASPPARRFSRSPT